MANNYITKGKLDKIIDLLDESGNKFEEAERLIGEISGKNMDDDVIDNITSNRVTSDNIYNLRSLLLEFRQERYGE